VDYETGRPEKGFVSCIQRRMPEDFLSRAGVRWGGLCNGDSGPSGPGVNQNIESSGAEVSNIWGEESFLLGL